MLETLFTDQIPGQIDEHEKRLAKVAIRKLVAMAVCFVIATDVITGLVQRYSDLERGLEAQLAQLSGSVNQLSLTDSINTTQQPYSSLAYAQYQIVRLQVNDCLDVAQQLHYSDVNLDKLQHLLDYYSAAKVRQLRLSQHGNDAVSRNYLHTVLEPASNALTSDVQEAATHASGAAYRISLYSHYGSIGALLATFIFAVLLYRRIGEEKSATLRIAAERGLLSRSEQRFQSLVYNSSDVIAIIDCKGRFTYLSSATSRLWQYNPADLQGALFTDIIHPDEKYLAETLLQQVCSDDIGSLIGELRLKYPDSSFRSSEVIYTNLLADPDIVGIVLTCRDVSERKVFERQLAHQAFHDSLTGLANRSLFMERMKHALQRTDRSLLAVGLIFLDLDNFKIVNDSLGHQAGDTLLKAVSERLQQCVRMSDTVARLGGDEFTILLEDIAEEEQVQAVVERITQVMLSPINLDGREIVMTGSLGIAISHGDYTSPDALLRDADTAMYQAKSGSKATSVVFDASMNNRALERLELEIEMRHALETGGFCVHYQPILSLKTGEIVELEALVRWQHPQRGIIPPAAFIPLAEETGLIVPLGKWVLYEACKQAKRWQSEFTDLMPLSIGVNLSARQLLESDIVETIARVLEETQFYPPYLKLEITESVMMEDRDAIIPKLHELKKLGVCLALDDFGTGYSSMSYLSTLPLDIIKIDRSFVLRLGKNNEDEAIVGAIVQLAKTLNLQITSEGIETQQQLNDLRALGCDTGQGYLFAKPIPLSDVRDYLLDATLLKPAKAA